MTLYEYLEKHYTPATVESYYREISIFLSSYPAAQVAGYAELIGYLVVLRERYNNAATLNRILCSIKAYYDYLCCTGSRDDHPARSILLRDQRNRDVQLQDLFTGEELEKLLERKERYQALYYRNRVLMGLLAYQGLKPQEMAQIGITDINLEAGSIYIKSTHTTNSRTLSLKPGQILLLYTWLQQVRPQLLKGTDSDALLIGHRGTPMSADDIVKHVLRSYKKVYADRRVTAQIIRGSVIANLLVQGHDISVVQQFAGHKYPSSTERYRQSQVETLKAAIEQYHPMK
ncbi:tyrosine-type recombinase/integrase [Chitinophaga ginsengisegetis]|uniref:tyrosine-type recombinase/integrase n=1 Tax=Chitinophaga ginsengisegetis TaxID=393003 RepID=UPI000DBA2C19|nr:tyrosine-type recombinase/integrase [Chitinophaga ginsengisegetis]MDR6571368.1 integrase/recombinase XerD [Chitinophaga ginsengisegetis]MDR6651102.1 integrase/recombinase XerD [Chitinophaga ginsengisegetis]MDR6657452.1 integrase/recombinase XerD [Chitinophaga ginsengisegetis]